MTLSITKTILLIITKTLDFLHLITQVLVSGIRQKDGILEHLTAANGSDDDKGETPIVWDPSTSKGNLKLLMIRYTIVTKHMPDN